MPLPSGRGSTGDLSVHGSLADPMATGGAGSSAGVYPAAAYGRPQGHDVGAPSTLHHQAEETMYLRSGPPSGTHHLPTVAEEDILSTVSGLELVGNEQEPDLSEVAAACAAAARGGPSLEVPAEPTRILVVRNVAADAQDAELQDIFQAFGDVQGLHTASKALGVVVVAYYDLRAAVSAQSTLQGTLISKLAIDVQFAPSQNSKAVNQGQVVVFNLDPDTSNDQLVWLFSKFGEVKGIKQAPTRPNQKFITFYDVRHAAAAMRAMNRAEQLNKIPSYVTPQQMASLQTVTSGPNLMQLAQMHGVDGSGGSTSGATGQANASGSSWDGLPNPATMEGLLQLVQNQQNHAAMAGMMGPNGPQDPSAAFNRLAGIDPLAANARTLPLSDSASSIAGVPHNLLVAAGSQASSSKAHMHSHMPAMPASRGMPGLDNSQAAAAMYNAAAAAAADRQAAVAQQQLQQQLLQASEAANMLMGLNLGGMDPNRQQANTAASLWDQQNKLTGMQDAAAGLWPGAASMNYLHNANATANIGQLAALQELQLRQQQQQQQAAALQQAQALQQAASANSMNPLNAANLQAAAQILQAAGLGQLGAPAPFLPNAAAASYNANAAAQILQQAGLVWPGLGLGLNMNPGALLGAHGMGARGGAESSSGNRSGGRLSRRTTDPVAEAERKAQQEKLYALDLEKIGRGEDKRTTLMIKNIPNKYTQKMLLATVDEHFKGTYDFFYLPIDFKNKCNVGYAFINMVQPIHIIPLVQRFNHKKWERFNSEKVCSISYARIQGRAALVQHFQNSSLMHEDKRCRPILFTLDDNGELAGDQEPFPAASGSNPGSGLNSMGSGARLSGLAGSSNSLRSQGGSTNSLRDLQHKHAAAVAAAAHGMHHQ